ncbi:MAG: hypothetical protein VX399_11050, partial [SAR324 cluster bacterium]|nr:hypothetical protein [SAR324 cluster bacterium]
MGINNPGGHVWWETETYKALENRREELDRTAEDQINDIREMRDLFKINDSPEEELKKAIKKIKAWIKQWHKEKIKTPSEIESFGLNDMEISERKTIRGQAGYQIQELEDVLNEFQTSLGGIDQGELIPSPASAPPPEAVPQTRKKLTWQKSQVSLA